MRAAEAAPTREEGEALTEQGEGPTRQDWVMMVQVEGTLPVEGVVGRDAPILHSSGLCIAHPRQ